MAMVGWVRSDMVVVVGMPTKPGGVGRMSGDAGALPDCVVESLLILDHADF